MEVSGWFLRMFRKLNALSPEETGKSEFCLVIWLQSSRRLCLSQTKQNKKEKQTFRQFLRLAGSVKNPPPFLFPMLPCLTFPSLPKVGTLLHIEKSLKRLLSSCSVRTWSTGPKHCWINRTASSTLRACSFFCVLCHQGSAPAFHAGRPETKKAGSGPVTWWLPCSQSKFWGFNPTQFCNWLLPSSVASVLFKGSSLIKPQLREGSSLTSQKEDREGLWSAGEVALETVKKLTRGGLAAGGPRSQCSPQEWKQHGWPRKWEQETKAHLRTPLCPVLIVQASHGETVFLHAPCFSPYPQQCPLGSSLLFQIKVSDTVIPAHTLGSSHQAAYPPSDRLLSFVCWGRQINLFNQWLFTKVFRAMWCLTYVYSLV